MESIYEWCLTKELELRGLPFVSQQIVVIEYKFHARRAIAIRRARRRLRASRG